ncbi:uncharacterized protein Aud_004162 [Aspergillus udagawae]|uniref:Major facilitator superfamily (MFS) profile domain-containing protein n=1 Tax=Aspergillus udagawae TaxID=91492 RepID=A0A8E0QRM2_9EURO|nr:uncharacterized protein Aud_004162 [Aspergillus udagawae]GIC87771.1 hypothetical protein Aud_004162 [Aspergillus udagawae]
MHMSRNLELVLSGAAQCTYLVGSAIPVLLMDRFGRPTLLMVCSAGLCLCFVMVSLLLSLEREGAAYGATAFIYVFQLFYGVGWLPVPWFYPAEINTTVRTKMQAIASGWNWMAVFAVVKITPTAFANIGGKTFIIFAAHSSPWSTASIPKLRGWSWRTSRYSLQGGVTGGDLTSKGGRTVAPGQHARDVQVDRKVEVHEIETTA